MISLNNFVYRCLNLKIKRGSGQDRTVDLTIFSRALVPTELPSQYEVVLANSLKLKE